MEGKKYDEGKLRYSLLPPKVIEDVLTVLEIGAKKYDIDNWKYVPNFSERYYNAALRHIQAWYYGEGADKETGISHLSHAICCLMFLNWKENEKNENLGINQE